MRIRLEIVAALLITPFPARPQSSFTVGTATAAPGQKATGYLEVPAGVDAATSIPVVVVNGAKPGKVLALVSGAHGTEYVSIIAIEKLIDALDPAQVTGIVILVPLINIQSFEQKVPHVNPIDNKSMNRRSEEHTSELQSRLHLVCRLLLEKKKTIYKNTAHNHKQPQ